MGRREGKHGSVEEPRFTGTPAHYDPQQRSLFTLIPSLEFAERCYDIAKFGEIPEQLWVDCVIASNADPSLAPAGRHIMTCFVQYVPYNLRQGTWDENRELLGDRVVRKIAEYAPNVANAIIARQVLTPLDLERTYGLTEGNIFHGDLTLEQLFFNRPVAGWSQYRTPIAGLYLCGAGAHPGGGVTGAPGYNARAPGPARLEARQVQGGCGLSGNGSARTADVVILGAGVMGASIAFQLARRKAGRIVVLDKITSAAEEQRCRRRSSACITVLRPRCRWRW
jgi:phytoene dehydrogenase-like protein